MLKTLSPTQLSVLIHAAFLALFVGLSLFKAPTSDPVIVPVEMSAPKEIQNLDEVKPEPKVVLKSVNESVPTEKKAREIFGASRNSLTSDLPGEDGIAAKKGNTLTKAVDSEKLLDSDADSLPTPTEEYLVSEMPSVLSEVRPVYPQAAKDSQIEGVVALDILIDESGLVRQVSVIEGPDIFRTEAVTAMRKFRFRPAKVDGKPVAVRIRYSLRFQLEY